MSPSAEQFSRVIFRLIDAQLKRTRRTNGEQSVALHSFIAHETDTGYAQCFRENAYNPRMGAFELEQVVFSERIQQEWHNPELFKQLLRGLPAHNPDLC